MDKKVEIYNELKKKYTAKKKEFERVLDIAIKQYEKISESNRLIRDILDDLKNLDSTTSQFFRGVKILDNDLKELRTYVREQLQFAVVYTNRSWLEGGRLGLAL